MKYKTICHLGGWNRNAGDYVILSSIKENFQKLYDFPLNFIHIDYQKTPITKNIVEYINKETDMLLIGSGGSIMNRPEHKSVSGWQFNIEKKYLRKIYTPMIVYGIGYNKFSFDKTGFSENMNEHLIETQEQSHYFSVRNYGTKRELIKRGLDENNINVIPDAGSFLTPLNIKIPGLKKDKFKIAINLVSDRPNYTYPNPYIECRKNFIDAMCDALLYLIKNNNAQIIKIEHIKNIDKLMTAYVKEKLGENFISIEEVLPCLYPPDAFNSKFFVDIYNQMDLVLGMRAHSNIIPWGINIPFISIGSNNKNKYFMEYIDEEKYFIDLNYSITKDDILDKIRMILNDADYKDRNKKKVLEKKKFFIETNKNILNFLDL